MLEDNNSRKETKAEEHCINEEKQREGKPRMSSVFNRLRVKKEDIASCKSFYSNSW